MNSHYWGILHIFSPSPQTIWSFWSHETSTISEMYSNQVYLSSWCLCLIDPDTSLHYGGCTANRWSSTCWGAKKESTCSVKPFRWAAFFHSRFWGTKPVSQPELFFFYQENNCTDNGSAYDTFIAVVWLKCFCLISGNNFIFASGTFRVT